MTCRIFRFAALAAAGTLLPVAAPPLVAQVGGQVDFPHLGEVRPRHAREIRASNWSIGAETMDREYTIYRNWREHLGPLGIKKARIQAGWARTERQRGIHEFGWLDEIITDMVAQGVEPWVNVSYGNTIYEGGGGTLLKAKIPETEEALAGWDRWVRAMAERYRGQVREWEIWNEANDGRNPAPVYAELLIRSAETIRSVQPEARILAMATAGVGVAYTDSVLGILAARGKAQLIDEVTYHPYNRNPDASYAEVPALREVLARHAPHAIIRQGENGAPSAWRRTKALSRHHWTELTQAKWALRRMLGDLGHDIPSTLFSMIDMMYPEEMNMKGLLRANGDGTVAYRKPAYRAVQHLASIFDDRLRRIPDYRYERRGESGRSLALFGYAQTAGGGQVVTLWFDDQIPSDSNAATPTDLAFPAGAFTDPVLVDLLDGTVYDIPDANWSRSGGTVSFTGIPVYDSPVLIAERSAIMLRGDAQ